MSTNPTTKDDSGNTLVIRPAKELQSFGKSPQSSWLRKIFGRIKIDQQALRQTLEVTFWR